MERDGDSIKLNAREAQNTGLPRLLPLESAGKYSQEIMGMVEPLINVAEWQSASPDLVDQVAGPRTLRRAAFLLGMVADLQGYCPEDSEPLTTADLPF